MKNIEYRGYRIIFEKRYLDQQTGHAICLLAEGINSNFCTSPSIYNYPHPISLKQLIGWHYKTICQSIDEYLDNRFSELELWCIEEKAYLQDLQDQIDYHLDLAETKRGVVRIGHQNRAKEKLELFTNRLTIYEQKRKIK